MHPVPAGRIAKPKDTLVKNSKIALVHGMGKPSFAPEFSAIPEELRKLEQWVLVRIEGTKKMPLMLDGTPAKSNDPTTWSSFDTIATACVAGGFGAIAFASTESDPY